MADTFIMRHPYGIWNLRTTLLASREKDYETSLWDLKLGDDIKNTFVESIMRHPYGIWNLKQSKMRSHSAVLWDIPMGFETHSCCCNCDLWHYYETSLWDLKRIAIINPSLSRTLWDIPMGFETHYPVNHVEFKIIMRHPYGIWNLSMFVVFFVPIVIMRHPYGIWNSIKEYPR